MSAALASPTSVALACRPVPARAAKGYVGHKLHARAERNCWRTDGLYCRRCGEKLDPAKSVHLSYSGLTDRYYATSDEADDAGDNMGGYPFGPVCAEAQLLCDGGQA